MLIRVTQLALQNLRSQRSSLHDVISAEDDCGRKVERATKNKQDRAVLRITIPSSEASLFQDATSKHADSNESQLEEITSPTHEAQFKDDKEVQGGTKEEVQGGNKKGAHGGDEKEVHDGDQEEIRKEEEDVEVLERVTRREKRVKHRDFNKDERKESDQTRSRDNTTQKAKEVEEKRLLRRESKVEKAKEKTR